MGQCVDKDVTIEQHDEKTSTFGLSINIMFFFFNSLRTDEIDDYLEPSSSSI